MLDPEQMVITMSLSVAVEHDKICLVSIILPSDEIDQEFLHMEIIPLLSVDNLLEHGWDEIIIPPSDDTMSEIIWQVRIMSPSDEV